MEKLVAHLRLMRPANILTAIADILAGFAVSGAALELFSVEGYLGNPLLISLLWLMLSTIGLYGGGIVFNDVFDADLDKQERPERPIPSGKASVKSAGLLAGILLFIGIFAAWRISPLSGMIAIGIAVLAVLYNAWGKHRLIFGPVNMGLCRGGNLLLGVSVFPAAVAQMWFIALLPVIYIAAITMISRGEVHGGKLKTLVAGGIMYMSVIIIVVFLAISSEIPWWQVIPFLVLFCYLIFSPLIKAMRNNEAKFIGRAVKAGVLSLIVLNASLAAVFAGWGYGIIVLLLLPVSMVIAKHFSVT